MAINYTVSYTFSPNTTIVSAQVNTNFSDNANTWAGLEAKTKSFSNLQVDATPTSSTDVAIKSYVDKLNAYRRPVLQYNSATVVNVETGLDGTSGDCVVFFPDGTKRTDTAAGRIQCNLAQVAALSGAWQSGLRTGSVAANTWYAIYAVKTTDDTSKMVMVADTVLPLQANFATLNSNFGTSGWVYLGMVRNGDNSGATTSIVSFKQVGNTTMFNNFATGVSGNFRGISFLTGTANSITYTTTNGTGTTDIPTHLTFALFTGGMGASASSRGDFTDSSSNTLAFVTNAQVTALPIWTTASGGFRVRSTGGTVGMDINLSGWQDPILGIGANPIL